jgi:hypothetical protein
MVGSVNRSNNPFRNFILQNHDAQLEISKILCKNEWIEKFPPKTSHLQETNHAREN